MADETADADDLREGSVFADYVIAGRLGQGGNGDVYTAFDATLDRRVALKVLRGAQPDWHRVVSEARMLAKLSHPNVVAVFEAGAFSAQPFVVMELVDGPDLRRWLTERRRDLSTVLDVFVQAGRGLQAAHDAGLVHRDFKPSNVLIARADEAWRAKVGDFGIACPVTETQDGRGHTSGASGSGNPTDAAAGTPLYMAPEQHERLPADARSDQFAYCVSLWEGLCGEPPYRGELDAQVEAKRAGPPSWPHGAAVPRWIRRIVDRGLAPRPADRWPSMTELLGALKRGDPRRHRRRTILVMGSGIALVGAGVGAGTQWGGASVDCRRAATEALEAHWHAQRREGVRLSLAAVDVPYAEATAHTVDGLLERYASTWLDAREGSCDAAGADPQWTAPIAAASLRCLEHGLESLGSAAHAFESGAPEIAEDAVHVAAALPPPDQCNETQRLLIEGPQPPPADIVAAVTQVREQLDGIAGALVVADLDIAGELATEGLAHARELGYMPLLVEALKASARVLGDKGNLEGALAQADEAYLLAHHASVDAVADTHAVLSQLARKAGDHERALREAKKAREIYTSTLGDEAPEIADCLGLMASALQSAGKHEEALDRSRQALAMRLKLLDPAHPDVARSQVAVGASLGDLGRYEEALEAARAGVELQVAAYGANHPDVAVSRANVGGLLSLMGEFDDALEEHEVAYDIARASFGAEHPNVLDALELKASTLNKLRRYDEALAIHREVLRIREATLPADHPSLHASHNALGSSLWGAREYDEALAEFRKALAIQKRTLGNDHPKLANSYSNLGAALAKLGRYAEAEPALRSAISIVVQAQGAGHPTVAYPRTNLASVLLSLGRPEEALRENEEARRIRIQALGADHPLVAHTQYGVGLALADLGRLDDALEALEAARTTWANGHGSQRGHVAKTHLRLGVVHQQLGQDREALAQHERAKAIYREVHGADSDMVAFAEAAITFAAFGLGERTQAAKARRHLDAIAATLPDDEPLQRVAELTSLTTRDHAPAAKTRRVRELSAALTGDRMEAFAQLADLWLARHANEPGR